MPAQANPVTVSIKQPLCFKRSQDSRRAEGNAADANSGGIVDRVRDCREQGFAGCLAASVGRKVGTVGIGISVQQNDVDPGRSVGMAKAGVSNPVDAGDLLFIGQVRPRIARGEDEEVYRREKAREWKVDIEGLDEVNTSFEPGEEVGHTQRQVALLPESAPPTTGPMIDPTPQLSPIRALYKAASDLVVNMDMYVTSLHAVRYLIRFCPISIAHPRYIPAPPIPAITRPTIRELEVGAAPQRALPTSNTKTLNISRTFTLNSPYARVNIRMVAADAIGNPRPTHCRFSICPRSL